jgi:DNA repair protein RecO (recombination protein O)
MNRNFSTEAIILSIKSSGENNSTVTLLTKSNGILYATLYGGPKSKMKSLVTTWNSGVIYLYENPTVKGLKITDFDVKNYHSSFSQNLFKLWAASLVAEISIKKMCGK